MKREEKNRGEKSLFLFSLLRRKIAKFSHEVVEFFDGFDLVTRRF